MTAEIYHLIITGLVLSNIILLGIAFRFNQERHHYKRMSDFWKKATDKLDRIKEILEEK